MIFSDSDRKRIEKQFDSYCKKTVRNRARDIYRAKGQRRQQEVLFSELSYEPAAPETLYKVNMNSFSVLGNFINIESDALTEALRRLPEKKRIIILLSYFMDMTDQEISRQLHSARSSVQAARNRTLKEMRDILESKK